MEISETLTGGQTVGSPNGALIACITAGKLRVHSASEPRQLSEYSIQLGPKLLNSLQWSPDSDRLIILSPQLIQGLNINVESQRVKIDNGSGGLGKCATAEFLTPDHLFVTWEFGRAKVFDLSNGRATELGDVKTAGTHGQSWQLRPAADGRAPCLAMLNRLNAEDQMSIYFPTTNKLLAPKRLHSIDIRRMSWSPDGRWIATLDTPYAVPQMSIYTAGGNHFKSYVEAQGMPQNNEGICVKCMQWSPDGHVLAIGTFTEALQLANTRTFTPIAIIAHSTTIDQTGMSPEKQALIWQETISASGARYYTQPPQPVSPPLSRTKEVITTEDLGTAEMCFSCDGRYLATRDERMLSTISIWDMSGNIAASAVLIQHSNVRKVHWHPSRSEIMLIDCGEMTCHLWNAVTRQPPIPVTVPLNGTPTFAWLHTATESKPAILASTKSSWCLLWPEGKPNEEQLSMHAPAEQQLDDTSEDSLFDVLSGRKPMPQLADGTHPLPYDDEDENIMGLEDTFREKKRALVNELEIDPLDDSEIF